MTEETQSSPRDYLAAERTFLAWIRTGVALIGLGFVLARFGLFLQVFNYSQPNLRVASFGLSLWFGVSLIFLGVLACFGSLARYLHLIKLFKRGETTFDGPSTLAVAVAVLLAILGLAMGCYMLAAPSVALDLPLKILVAEDATGTAWISYNASEFLQERHNLPAELLPNIAVIEALAAKASQ